MLERIGYAVLEADDGAAGLRVWSEHRADVDAVVTDLRMPVLGGAALAARLRAERADLPIVFVSGYAEEDVAGGVAARQAFLAKPFGVEALAEALAGVLA
jgi:two-component system cell cycle sensor histidine kinase/response regulator CckA